MNITWKDILLMGLGAIITLLATFKLIDLMLLKDKDIETAVVAFIGTIIGGVLSGAITLIGVNKTIQENRRIDNKEKYLIANYIFTELLPELTQMNNKIKSLNQLDLSNSIEEVKVQSERLMSTAKFMKEESKKIDLLIYREVKNIEYNADNIISFIKTTEHNYDLTDREIYLKLMFYRNEIAKSDEQLFKLVNKIKHSK